MCVEKIVLTKCKYYIVRLCRVAELESGIGIINT